MGKWTRPWVKYAFIHDHRDELSIQAMCRVFKLHRSGFYAWLDKTLSNYAIEYLCLLARIEEFYIASGEVIPRY